MDSFFDQTISIEKFAAFLDGNLSSTEMDHVFSMIEESEDLREIVDACYSVDKTSEYNEFLGETLPEEILNNEFDIPNLDLVNTDTDHETDSFSGNIAVHEEYSMDYGLTGSTSNLSGSLENSDHLNCADIHNDENVLGHLLSSSNDVSQEDTSWENYQEE